MPQFHPLAMVGHLPDRCCFIKSVKDHIYDLLVRIGASPADDSNSSVPLHFLQEVFTLESVLEWPAGFYHRLWVLLPTA